MTSRVQDRDAGRLQHPFYTDPSNLHCSALFTLTHSPRLTTGGISESEGLLSVQVVEHHSSKHIPPTSFPVTSWISTLFPRRLPHKPPVGPCWQLTWLYTETQTDSLLCRCGFSSFPHTCLSHLQSPCMKPAISILSSWIAEQFPLAKAPSLLKICNLGKLKAI